MTDEIVGTMTCPGSSHGR